MNAHHHVVQPNVLKGYWGPQGEAMQINLEAIASIEGNRGLSLTWWRLITLYSLEA